MEHYLYAGSLDHLRAQGETLNDEDIARLSPAFATDISICSAIIPSRWQNWCTRTSETIKRGVRGKNVANVSFRSTERQTLLPMQEQGEFHEMPV